MNRSFNNYDAFKRDLSPNASKADYRQFLTEVQKGKLTYDSNIANAIDRKSVV